MNLGTLVLQVKKITAIMLPERRAIARLAQGQEILGLGTTYLDCAVTWYKVIKTFIPLSQVSLTNSRV